MLTFSAACNAILPPALADYLLRVANESEEPRQTFVLSARYLAGEEVQDILIRRGNASSWRRVFSSRPVQAVVLLERRGDDTLMYLPVEAEGGAGKCFTSFPARTSA